MKKKKESGEYTVTLQLGPETYETSAPEVVDAILALKPKKITSRAIFTLSHNGKTASFMRNVARTRRTLSNRLTALILGKHLLMRLK